MAKTKLDHPTLARVRAQFPGKTFYAATFRGQSTLVTMPGDLVEVMAFLRDDSQCHYDFLSDVIGVDYLKYPGLDTLRAAGGARFAVVYNLVSTVLDHRLFVKVYLDSTLDTTGIDEDPALKLPSMTGLWPGAEWMEREVFDMLGIRFSDHPDLRRILTWETYPAHPLRKDYPLRGRGERETYRVIHRDSA